jgi:hypothetical protein
MNKTEKGILSIVHIKIVDITSHEKILILYSLFVKKGHVSRSKCFYYILIKSTLN